MEVCDLYLVDVMSVLAARLYLVTAVTGICSGRNVVIGLWLCGTDILISKQLSFGLLCFQILLIYPMLAEIHCQQHSKSIVMHRFEQSMLRIELFLAQLKVSTTK